MKFHLPMDETTITNFWNGGFTSMEQWEIERRHDEGLLPDWMYYQLSDKPA